MNNICYCFHVFISFHQFFGLGRLLTVPPTSCTRGAPARQGEATFGLYLFLRKILGGIAGKF
jgi:hypothetical protein